MGSYDHRVRLPLSSFLLCSYVACSPENTLYEGGLFKAHLTFPHDYPLQPPKMQFKTEMWHPNVYPSGLVCISILHPPEDDKYGYEDAGERWLPVHTPHTILLSVISMVILPQFFPTVLTFSCLLPMMRVLRIQMLLGSGAMITLAIKDVLFD
jgi:hypothetical protein